MNIEEKLATAIAAANEFKYMLDIQPGKLFYLRRKKIDPRDSACYRKAAENLRDLTLQEDERTQDDRDVMPNIAAVAEAIANDGADAIARPINTLADVIVALSKLGIEKISNGDGSSEDGRFFVFGVCSLAASRRSRSLPTAKAPSVIKPPEIANSATDFYAHPNSPF